ncbi:hypothetical protein ZOSMA_281G00060 [Zostera marina]|uniref:Uncharacterized protein n=1 Tax=Zostera marina TaxID=29655 RepID=A0A0K9PFB8_ZOSMR|nr:hypothetical protein ZOSMA_281G00060 [Zostera marina]
MGSSWVRTITSPFRKARSVLNYPPKNKKSQQGTDSSAGFGDDEYDMGLQGEVMACAYEDVQVMWSILDKSRPHVCSSRS